ncbi:MAG TPA: hypothetical protein VIY73_24670 [Polyangiaceae bacterium]
MTLSTLILTIAALLHRGTPPPSVVDAIATGCTEEAARGPVDIEVCAALVTTYAAHESGFRAGVYGDCGAGGCRSYGLLQEPAPIARHLDTLGQVRWWLATLRAGTLAGLDSSPTRARRRAALAARLLDRATLGVAAPQP